MEAYLLTGGVHNLVIRPPIDHVKVRILGVSNNQIISVKCRNTIDGRIDDSRVVCLALLLKKNHPKDNYQLTEKGPRGNKP
jgi:hypothetical protein